MSEKKPLEQSPAESPHKASPLAISTDQERRHEKLTLKQKLFVEHYLVTRNGTEAARLAGYAGNDVTLGAVAYENLNKPLIKSAIERRLKSTVMSANQVLEKLTEIASADWRDFVQVKYNGEGEIISAILPLKDQLKALELLGKYHALYTEKHVITELDREFEERLAQLITGPEAISSGETESETVN